MDLTPITQKAEGKRQNEEGNMKTRFLTMINFRRAI